VILILRQKLKDIEIKKDEIPFNALNIMYREILCKEELQSEIIGGFLNPNENLEINYKRSTDDGRNYVQYFFHPYEF
jgi:hypothetical protein